MQVALYEHEDQPNPFSLLFGIRRQNDTFHVGPADFDHATVRELISKGQRENTPLIKLLRVSKCWWSWLIL